MSNTIFLTLYYWLKYIRNSSITRES